MSRLPRGYWSARVRSRFVSVKIEPSPAIMLDQMAGSTMGIWVQHGEGRALFPERTVLDRVREETDKQLAEADAKLKTEAAKLRSEIDQAVPALAKQIVAMTESVTRMINFPFENGANSVAFFNHCAHY